MTKLYELLAVEPDLRSKAGDLLQETRKLFRDGLTRFLGQYTSYHALIEGVEELPSEMKPVATTVHKELERVADTFGNYLQATIEKELTNTHTSARVESLDVELPATALLNLEARLNELKVLIESIPTLDPSETWKFDGQRGEYVSELRVAYRTKKVPRAFVAYEATKEHPAQVQTYNEDVPSHRKEVINWSGAIPLAEQRGMIDRIDALIEEVKQARQRANDVEADRLPDLADTIFEYLNF